MAQIEYLTIAEAAKVLGLSRQRVNTLVKHGDIPYDTTAGNTRRLIRSDIIGEFAKRERPPHRPRKKMSDCP